jgi:hypothetical protein
VQGIRDKGAEIQDDEGRDYRFSMTDTMLRIGFSE